MAPYIVESPQFPSIGSTQQYTKATVAMVQREAGLITEYTVPAVYEVLLLVPTAPPPASSPMSFLNFNGATQPLKLGMDK